MAIQPLRRLSALTIEERIREAANTIREQCPHHVFIGGFSKALCSECGLAVMRALVSETARRCAEIAQEQAHRHEGSSMQLDRDGHDGLAIAALEDAAHCRYVERQIRSEFSLALADREGE